MTPTASESIEISRTNALKTLGSIRSHFNRLRNENFSPDVHTIDGQLDLAVIHIICASENARNPGLNLSYVSKPEDLEEILATAPARSRYVTSTPGFESHYVALDIAKTPHGMSVIALDSLNYHRLRYQIGKEMQASLPGAEISYLPIGLQSSDMGCRIFSTSAALKAHQYATDFDLMHEEVLTQGRLNPGRSGGIGVWKQDGVTMLPGAEVPRCWGRHF